MAQKNQSKNEWLDEMLRRMFVQTENGTENQANAMGEEEAKAAQAARDARRLVRAAMQIAIGVLDALDQKQDEADSIIFKRLVSEKHQRKAERHRLAEEERQRKSEQARQAEVEGMRRAMEQLRWEEKEQARILEDKKREERRRREDAERRATEKAMAEALKRAQEEARKCREAAERFQREAAEARSRAERAEEARRQQAMKAESERQHNNQQNQSTAWSQYTERWELLRRFALSATPNRGGIFRFEDIPWPMISKPSDPGMITKGEVAAFLYSTSPGQRISMKTRIRECLLTWHPDKFSGRWMGFVVESDRARVLEGVSAVARAGNEIMAEYASRRNTL